MSGLLDHARIGRRIRRWLAFLSVATLAAWLIGGIVGGGPTLQGLAGLVGVALLLAVLVEIVVVGGAAVGAALRAGAQGERLAAPDVALLPPQLRRRRGRGAR